LVILILAGDEHQELFFNLKRFLAIRPGDSLIAFSASACQAASNYGGGVGATSISRSCSASCDSAPKEDSPQRHREHREKTKN